MWHEKGKIIDRFFSHETGLSYILRETQDWPLLEISGIFMHRLPSPRQDALTKVQALRPKGKVLDTCFGLGYTSYLSSLMEGVEFVVGIERDINVLGMARKTPIGNRIFGSRKIGIILGDSSEIVKLFPDSWFDSVIHDPPRFSRAGELYSLEFYSCLARILRPGGKLFHYTGKPREKSGKGFRKGIKKRLETAGFSCRWDESSLGFVCRKMKGGDKR